MSTVPPTLHNMNPAPPTLRAPTRPNGLTRHQGTVKFTFVVTCNISDRSAFALPRGWMRGLGRGL
jgi:hypothetical protein